MKNIRLIQIGAGGFGQAWLQVVKNYPEVDLVAVVDMMPENLTIAKQVTGLPETQLFSSVDEAFESVAADLALIVTPPPTHKKLAVKALQSDLHVMLEKPMTHTYEEALDLVEIIRNYDKKVMVSQNYRWKQEIQTLKRLLQEGAIGQIGYIEYHFRKAFKFGGWRDQYAEILLEDMAIHHFDIMRFLLEKEAVEVVAQSFRPAWSWFRGNPSASVMIRFQNDVHVHYFGSWVARGHQTSWNGDVRIVGEHGAIEMIDDKIHLLLGDDTEVEEDILVDLVERPLGDMASSLNDMVNAIRTGKTPMTSADDNLLSFELTSAAIQSAKTGERIALSDFKKLKMNS